MEELGYYHPTRGYWQTIGTPDDDIVASFPDGTVEVALKPSTDHQYINGEWVHVPPTADELRAKMPPLTARQFRLGLVAGSFMPSQVTRTIDAMPDGQQKETAKIEWEYATTFDRMHPLISAVGAALGLTDEQIDAMWAAALDL